jgi:hypothetical protein
MTKSHNAMFFFICRILVYMYPGVNVATLGSQNIDCSIRVTQLCAIYMNNNIGIY